MVCLFALSGLGVAVLLLIGNELLQELLAHGADTTVSARIWWLVVAALGVAAIVSFAGAAGAGMHRLLAEQTVRYCDEVVLRLTAHVPLRELDSPEFHNYVERATQFGSRSPIALAMAVPQLLGSLVGAIGVAVGLAIVSPLLVPITLLACVPL
ncbi:hypothetical protein ABN034_33070 [Actinopolymorpha sp. B11F2]|uniref:hypothetical protein n=1 Tax=Actinopolymorpha sp. B11F2 TaxID=3160862 RepID=UPI0032E43F43